MIKNILCRCQSFLVLALGILLIVRSIGKRGDRWQVSAADQGQEFLSLLKSTDENEGKGELGGRKSSKVDWVIGWMIYYARSTHTGRWRSNLAVADLPKCRFNIQYSVSRGDDGKATILRAYIEQSRGVSI